MEFPKLEEFLIELQGSWEEATKSIKAAYVIRREYGQTSGRVRVRTEIGQ